MLNTLVKVVVVDDDEEDFLLIKDFLNSITGTRYEVHWIQSFDDAVATIKLQAADVYLVDFRLDGKTGLDIWDELKGCEIKKPMILLTGLRDHDIDVKAMEMGASDFIPKMQVTTDLLERSIRYSIKRSQDQEKLKEAERFKAEKEAAENANKAKSHFLAHMTHEIRTPLAAILGFADLILEKSNSERARTEIVNVIKRNGQHLLDLINDNLDLAKIEAGHLEIAPDEFKWREVINEVLELLKPNANSKGITLQLEIDERIPDVLFTDSHRMRQIFLNIVGNAIKFTDVGQVKVHCYLHRDSVSAQENLTIAVHDTGIGIGVDDHEKVFHSFKQAHSHLGRKFAGTGLGLEISRKLATALGGDLVLTQSLPQVGSVFTLTLPGKLSYSQFETPDMQFRDGRPKMSSTFQ